MAAHDRLLEQTFALNAASERGLRPHSNGGNPRNHREFVGSLERRLRVLQVFSPERPCLTLSEVSRLTGLYPATARRSLLTLRALGFLKYANRRFALRARVRLLSAGYEE